MIVIRRMGAAMDYFVLDVETANPNYASICQVGIIEVRGGEVVGSTSTMIDPQDHFDPFNISIHGITQESVKGLLPSKRFMRI